MFYSQLRVKHFNFGKKSIQQSTVCLLGKLSYIHLVISDLTQSFMAMNLCIFILSKTKTVIRIIERSFPSKVGQHEKKNNIFLF